MRAVNVTFRGMTAALLVLLVAGCSDKKDGSDLGPLAGAGGTVLNGGGGGNTGVSGGHTGGAGGNVITAPPCETIVGISGDCGTSSTAAVLKTPNILIVLDKSGSMEDTLGTSTVSRWDALNQALTAALPAVQDSISFGLEFFPGATNTDCTVPTGAAAIDVPIDAGATSVPVILSTVGNTTPGGGTPTAQALERAYEYFTTGTGAGIGGEKFVLLATDGGPNCSPTATPCTDPLVCTANMDDAAGCPAAGPSCCDRAQTAALCLDDAAVVTALNNLLTAGIPTFVVGLPGTEAYSTYLDAFAVAGGRPQSATSPKYYRVDEAGAVAGLTAAFQDITTQLIHSCDIQLNQDPPNPEELNVAINCEAVPATLGAGGGPTGGWDLDTTTTPDSIVLKGTTCDFIQTNGAERIDVVFGCPKLR
jgi:hypothetical protein